MAFDHAFVGDHMVLFTGPFSDTMPQLAVAVHGVFAHEKVSWLFLRDLIDELVAAEAFPPRTSDSSAYKIVQSLLREAVGVDGWTFVVARLPTSFYGAKGLLVARLPFDLPQDRALQPRGVEAHGPPAPRSLEPVRGTLADILADHHDLIDQLRARVLVLETIILNGGPEQ